MIFTELKTPTLTQSQMMNIAGIAGYETQWNDEGAVTVFIPWTSTNREGQALFGVDKVVVLSVKAMYEIVGL